MSELSRGVVEPVVEWDEQRGVWRILETDENYIEIIPMLVNFRVVETPRERLYEHGRFWCYPAGGPLHFAIVVLNVLEWGGDPNSEPTGWAKAWDGRRNGESATS